MISRKLIREFENLAGRQNVMAEEADRRDTEEFARMEQALTRFLNPGKVNKE